MRRDETRRCVISVHIGRVSCLLTFGLFRGHVISLRRGRPSRPKDISMWTVQISSHFSGSSTLTLAVWCLCSSSPCISDLRYTFCFGFSSRTQTSRFLPPAHFQFKFKCGYLQDTKKFILIFFYRHSSSMHTSHLTHTCPVSHWAIKRYDVIKIYPSECGSTSLWRL